MVATKLTEVTAKGMEWYNSGSKGSIPDDRSAPSLQATTPNELGYVEYATESMRYAMNQTSATVVSLVSNIYATPSFAGVDDLDEPIVRSSIHSSAAVDLEQQNSRQLLDDSILPASPLTRRARFEATAAKHRYPELEWMLRNPYSSVRGRHQSPSSVSAVRSLLTLVPVEEKNEPATSPTSHRTLSSIREDLDDSTFLDVSENARPMAVHHDTGTTTSKPSERASQLAEGTVRALRDLALEEALELHETLRFWTARWESPLFSWLEAGPWVWRDGYNHASVGQRVSQIQAVLARRCAVIGELQQHLLRAGWQTGVAQWGVVGGGQWAAVNGFNGAVNNMDETTSMKGTPYRYDLPKSYPLTRSLSSDPDLPGSEHQRQQRKLPPGVVGMPSPYEATPASLPEHEQPHYYGHSNVLVGKSDGGLILTDDPALASWSVDAMRLVRECLFRAGNGRITLPQAKNWAADSSEGELITGGVEGTSQPLEHQQSSFPKWAAVESSLVSSTHMRGRSENLGADSQQVQLTKEETVGSEDDISLSQKPEECDAVLSRVCITNLPLMASEVSDLLNSMEVIMELQRRRRLDKLKAPPAWRRNWYMAAAGGPLGLYILFKLLHKGYGLQLARFVFEKTSSFFREHVAVPLKAIYLELFSRQRRETISDHKARLVVIDSLQNMIRSWLEETFPNMPANERHERALACDMSLVEKKKEENMKTIYEINSVVRMSLIEMQFIKKEMMNAMYAMDEMMTSNEINMNLAAVTPAVLLLYGAPFVAKFCWYALLKMGKSREEVYAGFRHIVLDMERLLTMRDRPPAVPPPLGSSAMLPQPDAVAASSSEPLVLSSDDMGMLLLHIHACRTILWKNRRRFSAQIRRDVAEDLAELSGERGAVSVRQQLQIISRMCRTYPFLKVVSTGVAFDVSRLSHQRQLDIT